MANANRFYDSRRDFISKGLVAASLPGLPFPASPKQRTEGPVGIFNVKEFGASDAGVRVDTLHIQAAIDACAASGGGSVYFPPGRYLSCTIFLKNHVRIVLDAGATLLGSTALNDYPERQSTSVRTYTDRYVRQSLIFGEGLDDTGITGGGTIDGQGASFRGPFLTRPYIIRLISCSNVEVSQISLLNSPMWVQHYLECSHVHLHGLTVRSACNDNNDGMDVDACRQVLISNCDIVSGDDAIVLKSTTEEPCRDVTIANCMLSSHSNGLKLGTESVGGFHNITLSNCVVYDTSLSGIALESVDGGSLENVNVSNIAMRNVESAIFMRLGNRARPIREGDASRPVGTFRKVILTNIVATGADKTGCAIAGIPGHPVENVTLQNIRVEYEGGVTAENFAGQVPEQPDSYPEYSNFGVLPAYAFYCRHVRALRFDDVHVTRRMPDARPAVVCDDVDRLSITGLHTANSNPVILLRDTRRALLSGNISPEDNQVFVRLEGAATRAIRLDGNDLSSSGIPVERGAGVGPT